MPCSLCPVPGHLAEAINEWDLEIQPTLQSSSCVPDTGKCSPGERVAFFPVHTEMQYGLEIAIFFFKDILFSILNLTNLSIFILTDRNWRDFCFASLLAVNCGNH